MVGSFVEPVGVMVGLLVIRLNVTNLVSNFKTDENNDFYMDWTNYRQDQLQRLPG